MSLRRLNRFNIDDIPEVINYKNINAVLKWLFEIQIQEKLEENLLTSLGSEWKLEPKTGLRNQNVVLDDYGSYECQSLNQTKRTHFRIVVSGNFLL